MYTVVAEGTLIGVPIEDLLFRLTVISKWGSHGGSVIKNPPANVGDSVSIPGSGRSPGGGNGNPLQTSCWKIPWTEELGVLEFMGLQRVGHD